MHTKLRDGHRVQYLSIIQVANRVGKIAEKAVIQLIYIAKTLKREDDRCKRSRIDKEGRRGLGSYI